MSNDLSIRDILRTGTVQRFTMVNTYRGQTLAEHLYRVTMLSRRLYHDIVGPEANSVDYTTITDWALWHDLPEVVYGDTPTPLKAAIRESGSDVLEKLDEVASPFYAARYRAVKGTLPWYVVKIADHLEAIAVLTVEAKDDHARGVLGGIKARCFDIVAEAQQKFPLHDWSVIYTVGKEAIAGEEQTL